MNKISYKGLPTKLAGLAAGTAAAGLVQKGVDKLGLTGLLSNLAIVAVGALAPDMLGQKSPLMSFAGDAVIVQGLRGVMKEYFPALISGIDDVAGVYDDIAGPYGDYEVGDTGDVSGVDDAGLVGGAAEGEVTGVGNSI